MTNDKIQMNDPRLTAYALGEIDGVEAEAIRTAIENDPEALAFVAEMKEAATFLTGELAKEAQPRLAPSQREKLLPVAKAPWWKSWNIGMGAAGLVAAGIVAVVLMPEQTQRARVRTILPFPEEQREAMIPNTNQKPSMARKEEYAAGMNRVQKKTSGEGAKDALYDDQSSGMAVEAEQAPSANVYYPQGSVSGGGGLSSGSASMDQVQMPSPAMKAKRAAEFTGYGLGAKGSSGAAAIGMEQAKRMQVAPAEGAAMVRERQIYPMPQPYPQPPPYMPPTEGSPGESYSSYVDNPWLKAKAEPLSTFSIDVDTAAYANVRRMINQGQLPPRDAVRLEELVNYFPYNYAPPTDGKPFAVHVETAETPWTEDHQLVRIALRGKDIAAKERPKLNLCFLIDVSGSMDEPNKLPLVRESLKLLADQMQDQDRISIVVYAGASGLVLPPTSGDSRRKIKDALDNLKAGGSTNGGAGIELAYKTLQDNFIKGGVNRVVLLTDGDFNVGVTNEGDLVKLVEEKAKGGTFLSVLGFGMGNYKDSNLVKLSDKGNGNYAYIDTITEAKKALVEQMSGTLITIAKDVKIQVEFNPAYVGAYRLVGYEKRLLNKEDFNDDQKDAGEIGAGHTVTAFYEVIPAGKNVPGSVDPLKYQKVEAVKEEAVGAKNGELLTVKLRYKEPDGAVSKLIEVPVKNEPKSFSKASSEFQFASAVAAFGMLLRDSEHKGVASFESVAATAAKHVELKGKENEHRKEFVELVRKVAKMKGGQ